MNFIRIEDTDVILQQTAEKQGKIIISNTYGHNYSYFWDAMGGTIEDFILRTNSEYFAGCLGRYVGECPINSKLSVKAIRKALNEYYYSEYPWYKYKEFNKGLRDKLKSMEHEAFNSIESFMGRLNHLVEYDLDFYDIDDRYDEKNIRDIFKSVLLTEGWYYAVQDEHPKIVWLKKFHGKLVKELKKQKKSELVK